MEINELIRKDQEASLATKWLLLIFSVITVVFLGYYVWKTLYAPGPNITIMLGRTNTPAATTTKTTTTTTTPAATPVVAAWKTYTNTDYGFTLTLGDLWQGYEVKKLVPTDGMALAYYYFNMPTTDADYANATSSSSAGFASVFAISVMTPAQWTALQADGGPINDTIITQNTNSSYIIGYQHGQAYPQTLAANASNIATVIATFKNTP